MTKKAPSLITAARIVLRDAGVHAAVRRSDNATVVMAEGDKIGPAFTALRAAGFSLDVIGEGDYVQAAIVTRAA